MQTMNDTSSLTSSTTSSITLDDTTQGATLLVSRSIALSSRTNEMSNKTWWMVDLDADDTTQGATPLVSRCMKRHGWNETEAKRILKGYKQFLWLKKEYNDWDATLLSPSVLVDRMWHEHILDVQNYCHDMMLLCGRLVGHNPDGMCEEDERSKRRENTKERLETHFKNEYDPMVWKEIFDAEKDIDEKEEQNKEDDEENYNYSNTIDVVQEEPEKKRKREGSDYITLIVHYPNIKHLCRQKETYKVNYDKKLSNFFQMLSYRADCPIENLKFLLEGEIMFSSGDHTPRSYSMEDGDNIDVFQNRKFCEK